MRTFKAKIIRVHEDSAHYHIHEFLDGKVGEFEQVASPNRTPGYVSGWFRPEKPVGVYSDIPLSVQEFFFFKVKIEEITE